MLLFQGLQLRRYGTHACHRAVAGCRQREEDQLDDDGQEDDRPAPVAQQAVDDLQQPEDRLGEEPQEAVVDGQLQARRQGAQVFLQLGTGIEDGTGFALGAGSDLHGRASEADDVVALAVLAGLDQVAGILARHPGGDEVMLQPGYPATLDGFLEGVLVDVFHRQLLVGLVRGPDGGAQVGGGAGRGGRGRIATAVTLELGEQVAAPGLVALVVDQVTNVDLVGGRIDAARLLQLLLTGRALRVQAALEAVALDVADAVFAVGQVDNQAVLAFGQRIALLLAAPQGTAAGFVRGVLADQAALGQIGALAAVIEQLEGDVRAVLTAGVLRQTQLHDVATTRIDGQLEHVGLDPNQLVAGGSGRRHGSSAGLGHGSGDVIAAGAGGCRWRVRQVGRRGVRGAYLGRQGCLAIVLVPLQDHEVGHDCQGDDQDRALDIHDYSAIEGDRDVFAGGTGS